MTGQDDRRGSGVLLLLTIVYAAASLLHFAHNAVFVRAYPNLPAWITAQGVWIAWCSVTAVGAVGYYVFRRFSRTLGLLMLALYALLGFAGLDHYTLAPMSAHSIEMNSTILAEVAAAAVLLIYVSRGLVSTKRAIQ